MTFDKSKALLAKAGFCQWFETTLDLPAPFVCPPRRGNIAAQNSARSVSPPKDQQRRNGPVAGNSVQGQGIFGLTIR